jgi:hypothetical protein
MPKRFIDEYLETLYGEHGELAPEVPPIVKYGSHVFGARWPKELEEQFQARLRGRKEVDDSGVGN